MRLLAIVLCCGLAAALPTQHQENVVDVDVDHMAALLSGEFGVLEESSSHASESSHSESSQSSYFISTGGDEITEITVAEADLYNLECVPIHSLTESANIIVEESFVDEEKVAAEGESGAATSSSATEGAAASSAAAGGVSSSASASEGASASSAAAGGVSSSSSVSEESAASSAAAGGASSASSATEESAASSSAASGGAASSSAASGGAAASSAASGGEEEVGGAASSSAASGGAASSSAASGGAAASSAASGGEDEVGGAASSSAVSGGAASSSAASGGAAASSAASGGEEEVGGAASSSAASGGAASSAASGGAAASSAASGGEEEVGGAASSSAASGGAASSSAASGGAAASSAASGGEEEVGGVASSSATSGGAASSSAASGAAAASSAAAGGEEEAGGAASSSATSGGAAASSAASGEAVSSSAAAGEVASSSAAAGESASSSATSSGSAASSASSGEVSSSSASVSPGDPSSSDITAEVDGGYEEVQHPGGECVPYYLCKDNDIITDGAGIIDIRFGPGEGEESKSNSHCPNFLDVLCGVPLTEPDPEIMEELVDYQYVPSCGHRNPEGVGVILDGFQEGESQFGEFPWMAIILEDELMDYDQVIQRYVCGGSLVHEQVVMTGAHCVKGKDVSKLQIRLGDWDTQNEKEIFPYEEHRVASMEVHERFNSNNLRYDVALLFLEEPVELKQHVDTLCLPEENEDFDYASCVATGYGKDQFHGGRFQNIMKQVDLPVVPHRTCQKQLQGTRLGRWFRLHRTFTCAGGEVGVDLCRGDGGSPLACPSKDDPNKYVQVGIVAWGIGCGEEGVPGVYASVPKLVKWVNQKIGAHFGTVGPEAPSKTYKALPPV